MSKINLWRSAATAMRRDTDPRWHAVADWLDLEAATQGEMEPFANLLNAAIEKESGVKGYIRFGRKPDGEPSFVTDTNEGATAVALAYMDFQSPPDSEDALFEEIESFLAETFGADLTVERKRQAIDLVRKVDEARRSSKSSAQRNTLDAALDELGHKAFGLALSTHRVVGRS